MNVGILLAAGKSKRFGKDKLFAPLYGKPVIWHSLKFLEESPHVDEVIVAANASNKKKIEKLVREAHFKKVKKIILGGKTRFQSLRRILQITRSFWCPKLQTTSYFIIHNAANPHATQRELYQCIKTLKRGGAGVTRKIAKIAGVAVGRPAISTFKYIRPDRTVGQTLPRAALWEMETPQVVRALDFLEALGKAPKNFDYTDDLSVFEAVGKKTSVILASPRNRKITTTEDLLDIAVGIGEDSHRWKNPKFEIRNSKKRPLILGGIKIPHLPALEADSDGDVVIHAICNALAGALGKGSLGTYATRMAKRGIKNSQKYLKVILCEMERCHKSIRNCSISVEAGRPKIDPFAPRIKKNLSRLLKIPVENIGITATSGKKLTPFGRGEAIKCQVVCTCTH